MKIIFILVLGILIVACKQSYIKKDRDEIITIQRSLKNLEKYSMEISKLFLERMEESINTRRRVLSWYLLEKNLLSFYNSLQMNSNNIISIDSLNYYINVIKNKTDRENMKPLHDIEILQDKKHNDSLSYLYYKLNILNTIIRLQEELANHIDAKQIKCWETKLDFVFIPNNKTYTFNSNDSLIIVPIRKFINGATNCYLYRNKTLIDSQVLYNDKMYYKFKQLKKGRYELDCKSFDYYEENNEIITNKELLGHRTFEFQVK